MSVEGHEILTSEIETLRRDVDQLRTETRETKKPWYRQPSIVISMVALIASSLTTIYTQIGNRSAEIRSKKEEYRKIMMDLIALREEFMRAMVKSPAEFIATSQQLGAKKRLLLEDAERVATDISPHLTAPDYETLAQEHANDSNFDQAEKYFLRAADVASRPTLQAETARALGLFYFSPTPRRDFEKGRTYFARAVEALKGAGDPFSVSLQALNYEAWGAMEIRNGFPEEGKQKIDRARKYYTDLPADFPNRQHVLDGFTQRIAAIGLR